MLFERISGVDLDDECAVFIELTFTLGDQFADVGLLIPRVPAVPPVGGKVTATTPPVKPG